MAGSGTSIFLDTSVQIARMVHSPRTKDRIKRRISEFTATITSSVVKQEYKRRLLKEARYLLDQLNKRKSFIEVYYHVERMPESYPKLRRKRHICLQTLGHFFGKADDSELCDRLKLYLHYLLTLGLDEFEDGVTQVVRGSQCGCSKIPVKERIRFRRYEIGTEKCSECRTSCGIVEFLVERRERLQAILRYLQALPEAKKTDEIRRIETFLSEVQDDPAAAVAKEPCLTVGDLLIALESIGTSTFYTLNGRESQHLCRPNGQDLIVCPVDPLREEVVCVITEDSWHEF